MFNQDSNSSHIKFNPGKDSNYRSNSDEVGAKPTGNPRSGKDFKKILGKDADEEEEDKNKVDATGEDGEVAIADKKKKNPVSLFDLTGGSGKVLGAKGEAELAEGEKVIQSPSMLFSQLSSKKLNSDGEGSVSVAPQKENYTTRFDTEQPDLSYVNPLAAAMPVNSTAPIQQAKEVLPPSHIQDIINQLVQKISIIEVSGRTDTTLTLKHPPLFEGANLIVTAFDSAKGEFNISFENLTQAAKQLLDMRVNQESLRTALEQKGYAVHILTATTLIEHPQIAPSESSNREREEGQRQQQQQQRQQDEDETA